MNVREVTKEHDFIISPNGVRYRTETTQVWEILIQWKDGYTTWEYLKDVKESYMVQLAEYARQCKFSDKPTFSWWVPHVINKQECIIAEVKSKYWLHTQTFGIRVPKMVEESKRLDQKNSNHLLWEAVFKDMKNVRIAFDIFYGDVKDLKGYQFVECHMIFDIKMVKNGHMTAFPSSITYS